MGRTESKEQEAQQGTICRDMELPFSLQERGQQDSLADSTNSMHMQREDQ